MQTTKTIFRFAPSPNGELHLGHAFSALLNLKMARQSGGKILLRIEDIDTQRCTPALEKQMLQDLEWIGFEWDETPLRQSENFDQYHEAISALENRDLLYPSTLSRSAIREMISDLESDDKRWPRDPDGSPIYPGNERSLPATQWKEIKTTATAYSLRLHMERALLLLKKRVGWTETGPQGGALVDARPEDWGDVILARKDTPSSYHLCSVVDDAAQNVSHILRGKDLFWSTSIHRLLQELLHLPQPEYTHHKLILDHEGNKLSKSLQSTGLRNLREAGHSPENVREMLFSKLS